MSNRDYVLGTREPSGGDKVRSNSRAKIKNIPFRQYGRTAWGKSENNHARMKWMYDKEYRDVIVPAHPKEDVNTSRIDKEKKVMKEEKNRNTRYPT